MIYAGYDQSGKCSCLGSMFLVMIYANSYQLYLINNDPLIKDSKLLSINAIITIWNKYTDLLFWSYRAYSAKTIDKVILTTTKTLNNLLREGIIDLILEQPKFKELDKIIYYIDSFERNCTNLEVKLKQDFHSLPGYVEKLILSTKAESKYKIVALASIFARALRYHHFEEIKQKLNSYPYSFLNGDPSDISSKLFCKTYPSNEYVRESWKLK